MAPTLPMTEGQWRRKRVIDATKRRRDPEPLCCTDPGSHAWTCRRHAQNIFLCLNARVETDTAERQRVHAALLRRVGPR